MKFKSIKKEHNVFTDTQLIESEAIDQFKSAMNQEFVVKGALMPDCHAGYSLPIGSVVATDNFILPSWVGYDIGCGMCALPLSVKKEAIIENKDKIFNSIYRSIPTGFSHNNKNSEWTIIPDKTKAAAEIFNKNGLKQLASLGGGNHFIEIGYDESSKIWIIIHSGSRGIGHAVASHYMRLASGTTKAKEGHYGFRADSNEGRDYITDLNFCLEFALENRKQMIQRVEKEINYYCGGSGDWSQLINRNHNHAEMKDGLWIHRKGATHAENGMMGVIPGNMRDGSFIVRGKGNVDAISSSSHGVGRVLSRKKAKEILSIVDFENSMGEVKARVEQSTLDESPFAYKNIFEVMEQQKDLVEIVEYVKPLINIKG